MWWTNPWCWVPNITPHMYTPVLLTNIRLRRKCFTMRNALAYFSAMLIIAVKQFIVNAPDRHVMMWADEKKWTLPCQTIIFLGFQFYSVRTACPALSVKALWPVDVLKNYTGLSNRKRPIKAYYKLSNVVYFIIKQVAWNKSS